MPKKRSRDDKIICQSIYNKQRCLLSEPLTIHIMKEMNVVPLDDNFIRGCVPQKSVSSQTALKVNCNENCKSINYLKSEKSVSDHKKYNHTTPTGSPLKIRRDEFILFRKSGHFQSLEDHFSKLSDEIILHIFQWLPKSDLVKCSQVCKRWKQLSYDEALWKRYDFGRKLIKPGILGILLHRGVSVLRMAMAEIKAPIFTDIEFSNKQRFCKLQYLDISMATLPESDLASLFSVCNMLKKLSLEHCQLNEDSCRYIAQNKDLEVLNMAMCEGLTPKGLHEIALNCVKLKEWNLAWTHLSAECMNAFLPFLPSSLTRLNISGHREFFGDAALVTVVDRCPNLIELDISDSPMLTADSFTVLIENCSNLQHLHISRCYNIPTKCNRMLKQMKNFKKLEIFRTLTDEAFADLQEYMPEIKINQHLFSTIARPTTGMRRTSIWGLRVRD